ncbi:DUF2285 domain-containing protein [Sphingobium sp. YG1]|uniref:DUF2285 domain-containing protein n=1 Tax=Sphingobium sp. YG1 TaxID=2082188 RepID=UPI000DBB6F58|nr:DUF2285 domain-containing protein [Sphingobium sp. YG1]BBD01466.1 hypothetical protein YGS_C1P2721 [Sphingobium sp. YG1]
MPVLPQRLWPAASDYDYLASVGAPGLAWEWLRRDPAYRLMSEGKRSRTSDGLTIIEAASPAAAAKWGCLHMEDPHLQASDAMILWSAQVDPSVVRVNAVLPQPSDVVSFDLRRWASLACLVKQVGGAENLLLCDGLNSIRLDIMSGSLLDGSVAFRFDIHSADPVDSMIDTLRRFLHFQRTGAIPARSLPGVRRHQRAALALRVHDALSQGASIRDVGNMLFGFDRVDAEWEASGESLKSASRRLIALARSMASGEYLTLLR